MSNRIALPWKRTAIGGKYYATWHAVKQYRHNGQDYRIQGVIEKRWDNTGLHFNWTVEVHGGNLSIHGTTVGSGIERGSTAKLEAVKESASIAVTDYFAGKS